MDNMGSTLFYIVVMVAVLIGAYVTTKYFSGKSRRMMKSKHIFVLDRMALAKDKGLYLAKVGDKCILIGVTNQAINSLGEIDMESLGEMKEEPVTADQKGFLSKLAFFVSNAKSAPTDLHKARMSAQQEKRATSQTQPSGSDEEDVLERMSRAIEQRKNKTGGQGGGSGVDK